MRPTSQKINHFIKKKLFNSPFTTHNISSNVQRSRGSCRCFLPFPLRRENSSHRVGDAPTSTTHASTQLKLFKGVGIKKIKLLTVFVFSLTIVCSTAQALQPLKLVLDWYLNPNHAPLLVALDQGFFVREGLEVHFVVPSDPMSPPKLVAQGFADLGLSYQPTLALAVARGLKLRRIAALIDQPLNALMVRADGPIKQLKDLKNQRIAYAGGREDRILLTRMLTHVGLSLNDVHLVNVHFNLSQALLTHQVEAVIGIDRHYEPLALAQQGVKTRLFSVHDYGIPRYEELIVISQSQRHQDPNIQAFVRALQKAIARFKKDPNLCWQISVRHHPELNTPLNRQVWLQSTDYFPADPAKVDPTLYPTFSKFLESALAAKHDSIYSGSKF